MMIDTIRRIWRWLILGSAIPPPPPVPRSDIHRLTPRLGADDELVERLNEGGGNFIIERQS